MRILYWTEAFWPQIGGVEVLATKFLPAMRARGCEFTIVAAHAQGTVPPPREFCGMPVFRFPFHEALAGRDLDRLGQIRTQLVALKRDFQPDVVHLNFAGPGVFFHLQTAAPATPLLISLRLSLPPHAGAAGTLLHRALSSAAWVTANSAAVLDTARRAAPGIEARSSLIYNSVQMPALSPAPLHFAPPRLLVLSRLVTDKGVDLAIRALRAIRERSPNAVLAVAGDGPARGDLERLVAELDLGAAVEFLSWVSPAEVPALLNVTDVVLVPSRWDEAFGLVALEAAQMGRPTVATRVGGLPEVVVHGVTGLLVEREDVAALAAAVLTLIEHPDAARQMGEAARRRALEVFGWERYLDEYDSLYRHLVSESPVC